MKKRNNLKYKNQITFLGKLRKRFHELTNVSYEQVVISKIDISVDSYKFLYRNLVKINRAFGGSLFITLNKTQYAGDYGYTAVINLKVIR